MKRSATRGRRRVVVLVFGSALFGILVGAVTWLVLLGMGWSGKDVLPIVVGVVGTAIGFTTTFFGPLFGEWLSEKKMGSAPSSLGAENLERWRSLLRTAVLNRRVRG